MAEDFTNTSVRDNQTQSTESQGERVNAQASEAALREVNTAPQSVGSRQDIAADTKALTQGENASLPNLQIDGSDTANDKSTDTSDSNDAGTERAVKNKGDKKSSPDAVEKNKSTEANPEELKRDVVDAVSRGHVQAPGVRDELETVAQRAFKEGGIEGLNKLTNELDQGMKKNYGDKAGFEMSPVQMNSNGERFVHFGSRTAGVDKVTGKEMTSTSSSILNLNPTAMRR